MALTVMFGIYGAQAARVTASDGSINRVLEPGTFLLRGLDSGVALSIQEIPGVAPIPVGGIAHSTPIGAAPGESFGGPDGS